MNTKRLSKSVMEGGRNGRSKYERKHTNQQERVNVRSYLKKVVNDPEMADEEIEPIKRKAYKEFADKLGIVNRYLDSKVGQKWSEIYSEIKNKFDTRTTAGRHIVEDHLLGEVNDTQSGFDKWGRNIFGEGYRSLMADYYVDEKGILRQNPNRYNYKKSRREKALIKDSDYVEAAQFLNGRMIKESRGKYYWMCNYSEIYKTVWNSEFYPGVPDNNYNYVSFSLKYLVESNGEYETKNKVLKDSWLTFNKYDPLIWIRIKSSGKHLKFMKNPLGFSKKGELTESELKVFRGFPELIQKEILSFTVNL